MGDQELLFRSGIFTVVTLEGSVIGMGQLMVEQQLLVVTRIVTKLTLESGKSTSNRHPDISKPTSYKMTNYSQNWLFLY